ncbi:EbsA protein [Streptococcus sp. zg-86]|uniref:EbsA protein n=1 Tax=Streptococcus zhangguiae TaxID=2664091 RepID=A0A6I4RAF2_9STRE|nr:MULTISPECIES: EbsA family protein [unclassified Streptococcus]MTB64809.1 EbsA protein [Streptococcus sp. zg-86]MTB91121.1 EbsA protein [Streptococcus sp. zg-36]MWV56796.1 EbsA protein [Streptococcus sp. zg-70]QTH48395.1 EbsA family protein [Streptococcus sp. zg-86]
MIKIFGRIRYHWQPELSWSIIYWSLAITPAFLALSLILERLRISDTIIQLFVLVIVMFGIGWHRYFVIEEDHLKIASANPFATKKIQIATISKIEVTYLFIKLFSQEFPEGKIYYIRKWPKKYFINALALNPRFQGEIVLTDHLITQDYFEEYYANKD